MNVRSKAKTQTRAFYGLYYDNCEVFKSIIETGFGKTKAVPDLICKRPGILTENKIKTNPRSSRAHRDFIELTGAQWCIKGLTKKFRSKMELIG